MEDWTNNNGGRMEMEWDQDGMYSKQYIWVCLKM